MTEYPPYQQRTMAITSLWLLEPALVALSGPLGDDKRVAPAARAAVAMATVSFAHGWWGGRLLHMVDLAAARSFFVMLMALFPRHRWAGALVALAYAVMRHTTRRVLARMPSIGYHPELQCRCHLLFRYLGYWWVRLCFNDAPRLRQWLCLSGLQWASAFSLLDALAPRRGK